MVILDNDGFLSGLTKLFQQTRNSGSVFLTMKKLSMPMSASHAIVRQVPVRTPSPPGDNGQTKQPRGGFKKRRTEKGKEHKKHIAKASSPEPEENLCLLRATNGKKKLSTVVSTKEVTRFQLAYANLLKGNLDGLKKRDKKTAKAAAAKAKKSKATA